MKKSKSLAGSLAAAALGVAAVAGLGTDVAVALEGPVGDVGALLDQNAATISFQGVFTNNGGQPLPGNSVDLEFGIYEVGGVVPVGTVANATYPMTEGVVQAHLPVLPEWFDGTGRELGVSVDGGPEMSPRIPLTAAPYALRVNRVASQELDDDIWLGDTDTAGSLCLFNGAHEAPSITADGSASLLSVFNATGETPAPGVELYGPAGVVRSDGAVEVRTSLPEGSKRAWMYKGPSGGELQTWDNNNHLTTWIGTKSAGGGGGGITIPGSLGGFGQFQTANDITGVLIDGTYANNAGGIRIQKAFQEFDTFPMVEIIGDEGDFAAAMNMNDTGKLRVKLDANSSDGGAVNLYNSKNKHTVQVLADDEINAGEIGLADRDAVWSLGLHGDDGNGSRITMVTHNHETLRMDANDGDEMGRITFFRGHRIDPVNPEPEDPAMILNGFDGAGSRITLIQNGIDAVRVLADDGQNGGRVVVRNHTDQSNVRLWGCGGDDAGTCGGAITVYDGSDNATVEIDGDENGAALMRLGSGNGASGSLYLYRNGQANSTIHLNGDTGHARLGRDGERSGELYLYSDAGGGMTIRLNGDTGNGRFKSVTITGGADLAEPFDVAETAGANIEPGMVVSIDPNNPGQLKVSDKAYDRTVAGVISGAGGVNPGMVMAQNGSIAGGNHPVALTGRVYVYADATAAPITVGDLLTTSSTPGHAAKASDHSRAQGAIIGKAMTPLAEGRGLVLVLVSLQ